MVQPTPEARQYGSVVFGELRTDLDDLLAQYSERERDLIDNFLRSINAIVSQRADELSNGEHGG